MTPSEIAKLDRLIEREGGDRFTGSVRHVRNESVRLVRRLMKIADQAERDWDRDTPMRFKGMGHGQWDD
jgi:hypothetical protein